MVIKRLKNEVDLIGPKSRHVKLIAEDNREFIIKRSHAMIFMKLRLLVLENYRRTQTNEVYLKISARPLEVLRRYFEQYTKYGRYTKEFKIPNITLDADLESECQAKCVYYNIDKYPKTTDYQLSD